MRLSLLRYCLFISFLFTGLSVNAQSWVWARSAGGINADEAYATATDASGNVYATGYFSSSTITFGATTLTNVGGKDIFLVKYDASGSVLWATSAGSGGDDKSVAVATDPSGNVIITGSFEGAAMTFGSTTLTNTGGCCGGGANIFVVKYDASGTVLWAKRAGVGSYYNESKCITADASGNIYVGGYFQGTSITFDFTTVLGFGGLSTDMFLVKYDPSGSVLWAKSVTGPAAELATAVTVDPSGNVYVTGAFASSFLSFTSTTLTNMGSFDIFILKYTSSGTMIWGKRLGSTGDEYPTSITTDPSGNLYVVGSYSSPSLYILSTPHTNAGAKDVLIVKYDTAGNVIWSKTSGGTYSDMANAIVATGSGSIYVAGYFQSPSITFDTATLINPSTAFSANIFLTKYDTSGNVMLAKSFGGLGHEFGNALSIDAAANIYLAGSFASPVVAFDTVSVSEVGSSDICLAKYGFWPNPLAITGDTVICQGTSVTLSDATPSGTWSSSAAAVATVDAASGLVTALSAGTAAISYTISTGATSILITVNPSPSFSLSSNSPVCNGAILNLNASAASGGLSYSWAGPSGFSSILAAPALPGAAMSMSGVYSVTVTQLSSGCSASATTAVIINPVPIFYIVDGTGTYTATATVTLSGSETGTSYQLVNGATAAGGPVAGTGMPLSFPVTASGTYFILATSSAGCTDTMTHSAIITIIPSAVNDMETPLITVLPNPASHSLVIKGSYINMVQIMSIDGKLVLEKSCNTNEVHVDISNLIPGSYLLRINNAYMRSIIKE